ncbi:MAG: hypothetical protein ABSG83_07240 [Roseiarcus sp.]|jgi:hydroxymethylglutaryl-CoA reductase
MTRLTIMHSKTDNKSWLVDVDGAIVSEIDNDVVAGEIASDSDRTIVVEVRAHAASHAYHPA